MHIKLIAQGSSKWERYRKRWGISFLIDTDVLFDTFGDAGIFMRTVRRMNIDIARIQHVVISHDHWDHTAGLWPFLQKNKSALVYVCPGVSRETKERIVQSGARVIEAAGPQEIKTGIYTTGQIPGVYDGRNISEQAIVIKTARGAAVVTGCAHPGIVSIVDAVKKHFGLPVFLIAGGFHLKDASRETIEKVAGMLQSSGVEMAVPLHCSGSVACGIFKKAFGAGFIDMPVGQGLEL